MPILKTITAQNQTVPIKAWTDQIEETAEQQLKNVARLPFVFKHIVAMPDVHAGIGATIGSVIATQNAICPAAVGVDIGCGIAAIKTPLNYKIVQDHIQEIRHAIERSVPVGFYEHKQECLASAEWSGWKKFLELPHVNHFKDHIQKFRNQLGTLGSGNHFIEICLDTDHAVWIVLHSGSRNVGKTIAEFYIREAKGIMKKLLIQLPDPDLAYFPESTSEFKNYMMSTLWAQDYAMKNRQIMLDLIMKDLADLLTEQQPIPRLLEINCHHNYVQQENHFHKNLWITRKGAIRARKNDYGIIPGSMGTRSYVVRGKGNPDSFYSCAHGAGRAMSRKKARTSFTVQDLKEQTTGVECRKDIGVLDEIPAAYKDIDTVMEQQSDLVEVVTILKQIMCVKG